MKTIIALAALLTTVSVFAADEKPFPRAEIFQTQLSNIQIDPRLGYGDVRSGEIVLDLPSKQLSLVLVPSFHCPARMFCAQVMPSPIAMELPIIKIRHDSCGATVYIARLDQRPVDGNLSQVAVIDNRTNHCLTLNVLPGVHGKLKIVTAGFGIPSIQTVSTFEGSVLVPFSHNNAEAAIQ